MYVVLLFADSALLATVIVVSKSQHKLRTKRKITDIGSTGTHDDDVLSYLPRLAN